jgi:hypothetical protein
MKKGNIFRAPLFDMFRLYSALKNLYGTSNVETIIRYTAQNKYIEEELLKEDCRLSAKLHRNWSASGFDTFRNL